MVGHSALNRKIGIQFPACQPKAKAGDRGPIPLPMWFNQSKQGLAGLKLK